MPKVKVGTEGAAGWWVMCTEPGERRAAVQRHQGVNQTQGLYWGRIKELESWVLKR